MGTGWGGTPEGSWFGDWLGRQPQGPKLQPQTPPPGPVLQIPPPSFLLLLRQAGAGPWILGQSPTRTGSDGQRQASLRGGSSKMPGLDLPPGQVGREQVVNEESEPREQPWPPCLAAPPQSLPPAPSSLTQTQVSARVQMCQGRLSAGEPASSALPSCCQVGHSSGRLSTARSMQAPWSQLSTGIPFPDCLSSFNPQGTGASPPRKGHHALAVQL